MAYIVFIDTQSGRKKHSIWTSHTDCKQQVKILRNHGYKAWWEFIPAHGVLILNTVENTCLSFDDHGF